LILLFWASPSSAVTVAIVRPLKASPAIAETLVRLHGELLSVGIEPEFVDGPAMGGLGMTDSHAWLEEAATERGVDAIIAIIGDVAPVAIDVWVINKATRRFEILKVPVEPKAESASERLAIRALEVLRSSFLAIDFSANERRRESLAKPPAAILPIGEVTKPASHSERFGIEVGVAGVTSMDGVGPTLLPIVGLNWAIRSWLVVQVALAGLGTHASVATTAGNARVAQDFGVVGGCYRLRSSQRLRPFFAIAAGLLRTSVDGSTDSPNKQGHATEQWSLLFDGSLGAGLRLGDRFTLTVAAHAQMAEPYVAIHFVDTVVATSARPNFVLTLTVGAWL
jgi:hypothetical protein